MSLSVAELIDRLSIMNIKIFVCVEIISKSRDDAKVSKAARKAYHLNNERSRLVNEINHLLGDDRQEIKV